MVSISQLLKHKGDAIYAVRPDDNVFEAIRRMADHGIGALLVLEGDALEGIVSERDYARKVILEGKSSRSTPVADIMTREVITIDPGKSVDQALEVMSSKRIRHLPVVEDDRVVGVLSIGDLVQSIIETQQQQIENLEQYISS